MAAFTSSGDGDGGIEFEELDVDDSIIEALFDQLSKPSATAGSKTASGSSQDSQNKSGATTSTTATDSLDNGALEAMMQVRLLFSNFFKLF